MINKFLKYCKNKCDMSENTLTCYRIDIEQFMGFMGLSDLPMGKLRLIAHADAARYEEWLGDRMKPASICRKFASLRTFFKFLVKYHGLKRMPIDIYPIYPKPKRKFIYDEDVERMIESMPRENAKNLRDLVVILLIFDIGITITELVNLNREDFEYNPEGIIVNIGGRRPRVLVVTERCWGAVQRCLILRADEIQGLIINKFSNRMNVRSIDRIIKKHGSREGLKGISASILRNTLMCKMIKLGLDQQKIDEQFGIRYKKRGKHAIVAGDNKEARDG